MSTNATPPAPGPHAPVDHPLPDAPTEPALPQDTQPQQPPRGPAPQPPGPQPPGSRRPSPGRVGLIIGVAVAVLAVAVVGIGLGLRGNAKHPSARASKAPTAAASFTVHGEVIIMAKPNIEDISSNRCKGAGSFSDIDQGTKVVITDESDTTIAVTQLGVGSVFATGQCYFAFSAGPLPSGRASYGITVSDRDTVRFTQVEMNGGPQLTLGG